MIASIGPALRRFRVRAIAVAAFATAFCVVAHYAASWHTGVQNERFLNEIGESALRYVEATATSADGLLQKLRRSALSDCTGPGLQAVRLQVYEHSVIKDIRIAAHDGAVRCSAYSETLEFDRDWPSREAMLPADDGQLRVFRVQQFTSDALGVLRDLDDRSALVAIVGIDPVHLDVLPSALRPHGQVALELANGETIATSGRSLEPARSDLATVVRSSSTLPIRTVIRLDAGALGSWNAPSPAALLGGSGTLGALFGLLVARLVGRPINATQTLDDALSRREFRPFYQPIFSLADRRVLGCEMLMRWVLPDGRALPPSAFIPLAESTGRIEAMTWDVLSVALDELSGTMLADPDFKLSFNAVPRHFLSAEFPSALSRLAGKAGVSPGQIVVEMTEREELEDHERAKSQIRLLHETGFRFALDDVGVGHSGLSHIQSLKPHILKLDKFFVDGLGLDMSANVVVDMLVRLAGELGMTVVAEGVETDLQLHALLQCGVSEGQGYLVSPPVPLPTFLALLSRPEAAVAA